MSWFRRRAHKDSAHEARGDNKLPLRVPRGGRAHGAVRALSLLAARALPQHTEGVRCEFIYTAYIRVYMYFNSWLDRHAIALYLTYLHSQLLRSRVRIRRYTPFTLKFQKAPDLVKLTYTKK